MPGQGMAALASAYVDTLAIEKIQGRDLGLVARRQIASGEVFFCERPIVKVTHANGGYRAKFSGDEAAGQSHLLSLASRADGQAVHGSGAKDTCIRYALVPELPGGGRAGGRE